MPGRSGGRLTLADGTLPVAQADSKLPPLPSNLALAVGLGSAFVYYYVIAPLAAR